MLRSALVLAVLLPTAALAQTPPWAGALPDAQVESQTPAAAPPLVDTKDLPSPGMIDSWGYSEQEWKLAQALIEPERPAVGDDATAPKPPLKNEVDDSDTMEDGD